MIVYLEYLILINVVIHYLIIKFCQKIFSKKVSHKNLFLSILLLNVNLFIYLQYPLISNYLKYIFGLLIVGTAFYPEKPKTIIKIALIYFILNIVLGGFNFFLNIYNLNLNISLLISLIFMIIIFELDILPKIDTKLIKQYFYNINFNIQGKEYQFQAFLDTGNFSKSETDNVPIVILNEKHRMLYQSDASIKLKSLGQSYKMDIYRISDFYITIGEKQLKREVYLAFGDLEFDGIFGLDLLKE
ncbi:MAG: sigma-E processing peptidase SpoIIGA [Erysipelotrichales bacterium]|nr:sigma-E processing peptidase SpoIIGA [Erysipelotrichales bacterium]